MTYSLQPSNTSLPTLSHTQLNENVIQMCKNFNSVLFIVKKHGEKPNEIDKETAKRNVVNLYYGILCSHYIEQVVSTHLY